MGNVSVFDLRHCVRSDCISDALDTLLAFDANVRKVLLIQLQHVHADLVAVVVAVAPGQTATVALRPNLTRTRQTYR